jgi:hypothetical protein
LRLSKKLTGSIFAAALKIFPTSSGCGSMSVPTTRDISSASPMITG